MRELALHIMDIAQNSVAAAAHAVTIEVTEDAAADTLRIAIHDDGRGMDADLLARVTDPFVTSRTTRKVGLGIPLLKAAAESAGGDLYITSTPDHGATLVVDFQRSHLDRMPLGDLAATLLTLLVGQPEIHWRLIYTAIPAAAAPVVFDFDDAPIKETLGDLPLTEPPVLAYLRTTLEAGVAAVQAALPEPTFFK
jgi:anti-sigma regulatory factor (Ser/Thr protein kinase)